MYILIWNINLKRLSDLIFFLILQTCHRQRDEWDACNKLFAIWWKYFLYLLFLYIKENVEINYYKDFDLIKTKLISSFSKKKKITCDNQIYELNNSTEFCLKRLTFFNHYYLECICLKDITTNLFICFFFVF